jgi:hypothetical protein
MPVTQNFPLVVVEKIGSELYMISGFCRKVEEIGAFLGCYAEYSGNSLQTFRDNLSVPLSKDYLTSGSEKIYQCTRRHLWV